MKTSHFCTWLLVLLAALATVPMTAEALPNLVPHQPTPSPDIIVGDKFIGPWPDKIVVSNASGRIKPEVFSTSDTLFVDWIALNNGDEQAVGPFSVDLYVDGVKKKTWDGWGGGDSPVGAGAYIRATGYSLGSFAAGIHTIKIVIDSAGSVAESNESDNSYEKHVTISTNPDEWIVNPSNQHYYRSIKCGSWFDCDAAARNVGAHLVSIGDAAEQVWLVDKFGGTTWYWIGLNDAQKEGQYAWSNGDPVTFINWDKNEPNNYDNEGAKVWTLDGVKIWSSGSPNHSDRESYVIMNWNGEGWNYRDNGNWNDSSPTLYASMAIIEKEIVVNYADIERMLNLAESKFPITFDPPTSSFPILGYIARHYNRDVYLGSKDGKVYSYNLKDSGEVKELGLLDTIIIFLELLHTPTQDKELNQWIIDGTG